MSEFVESHDHFAQKITGFGLDLSKLQLFLCHAEALKCMLAHCANPGFIARFQLAKHGFHRSERPIAQKISERARVLDACFCAQMALERANACTPRVADLENKSKTLHIAP